VFESKLRKHITKQPEQNFKNIFMARAAHHAILILQNNFLKYDYRIAVLQNP
jgi:hypothetical protein